MEGVPVIRPEWAGIPLNGYGESDSKRSSWPVITWRVMLSATKRHVGLWLSAGSRVLAALIALWLR